MRPFPLSIRRSGILLHPTSLPGHWPSGCLGNDARRFIDFLVASGQSIWQMLPLGVPHDDGSPYQCLSLFAGNPALICPEDLREAGWLDDTELQQALAKIDESVPVSEIQQAVLRHAYTGFKARASKHDHQELANFVASQTDWLDDYALYQVLRQQYQHRPWNQWPQALRDRQSRAINEAHERLAADKEQVFFEQFVFFRQWRTLKEYANNRGVLLFGDMPIFIAYDSVDVWREPGYFDLDEDGRPRTVTGVPPDYFSATGQRWGNPHYRWDIMAADGFRWWKRRLAAQLELFDIIRIDHFRGFESSWVIPAEHDTAIDGHWVTVPGYALFSSLMDEFGVLPLVAEDLGIITPEVEALRDHFHLPGMKILQFAFSGDPDNPYLPENHTVNSVVYTGTHDNDTSLGWYQSLDEKDRATVDQYLKIGVKDIMPWPLIEMALGSVANTAILPMQDVLALDGRHRMNTPGTQTGNWKWRFDWQDIPDGLPQHLSALAARYDRLPQPATGSARASMDKNAIPD